jgi:hypothetical protein
MFISLLVKQGRQGEKQAQTTSSEGEQQQGGSCSCNSNSKTHAATSNMTLMGNGWSLQALPGSATRFAQLC